MSAIPIVKLVCRRDVETRKSIVTLFLARFTLDDEEAEAIASRDVPLGQRFYAAMDKTERIRNDCQLLMAGEDGPTKAGSVKATHVAQAQR
jgi:conserved oligomeric Golgi complex subunit 6